MSKYAVLSAAVLAVVAGACAVTAAPAAPPLYRITQSIPLGSPEQWDYLTYEPNSHRLYVAHGDGIDVLDGVTGEAVGHVPVPGANGIAVVPELGKGYAGSRKLRSAIVFDLQIFKILKALPADADTDGVVYDQASKRVFIMDGDPHNITVIDTLTDTVVGKVALDGQPEFAAVDGKGKLFVNIESKREIQRVDTHAGTVDATWPIGACEHPHGLSIDAAASRLFASCVNSRLLVVDSNDGKVVASLPIGLGSDGTAFDVKRKRAFSSNSEGTLSVIQEKDAQHFVSLRDVPTQLLARTLALDAESGRVYVVAADRIEVDPTAADPRKRYGVRQGSVRVLFADPVTQDAGTK